MKYSEPRQPTHHPLSTRADRLAALGSTAIVATANTLVPYSSLATNRVAEQALYLYQDIALDRGLLRAEIERGGPAAPVKRLAAAARRQRAALEHARSHEIGQHGWYGRSAGRMAANLIIVFVGIQFPFLNGSLLRQSIEFISSVAKFFSL